MKVTLFSALKPRTAWEVARHDPIYHPYVDWLSAFHDVFCQFSLSYHCSYFEPGEAENILREAAEQLTSVEVWRQSYSPQQLESEKVSKAHSEVVGHIKVHTGETLPDLRTELSNLMEKGKLLQADQHATALIDSLLLAYNGLLHLRRGAPTSKSAIG